MRVPPEGRRKRSTTWLLPRSDVPLSDSLVRVPEDLPVDGIEYAKR